MTKKQEIAPAGSTALLEYDPDFEKMARSDAGKGVSTDAKDNIVPSISVLQPLSPEVMDGPDRVEGAQAGDFLLSDGRLIKGREGFLFQPCGKKEWFFEFIPRENGGGFVNRYPVDYHGQEIILPDGAESYPGKAMKYFFPENGNSCTHYRFVAGILWDNGVGLEYVIPFFSTGHTAAKNWNMKWTRKRFEDNSIMAVFSHVYHLTTVRRTNKFGTWYSIETDIGAPLIISAQGKIVPNHEMDTVVGDVKRAYTLGKKLQEAFEKDEKREAPIKEDIAEKVGTEEEMPF